VGPRSPVTTVQGEEALAVERPAMTYVHAQLGDRLQRQQVQGAPVVPGGVLVGEQRRGMVAGTGSELDR
jgi:hypothetical protein